MSGSSEITPFSPHVDFAILTALEVEARAVVGRLAEHQIFRDESQDIRTYHLGKILLPQGQPGYRVVVVQLTEMGNVSAAIAVTDTIARWKPNYILMVGIAGGFPQDDLDLGDVVVADQVVGYDYGKVKPTGMQFRDHVYPASQLLLDRVRSFWEEAWADEIGLPRPGSAHRGCSKRFVGPIASGNKVVASEIFRKKLLNRWAKLHGVEMEAEGVYAAVFARPEIRNALVIRGICDMADERKEDTWQAYAANAAAAYAISFLKSKPVEPHRKESNSSESERSGGTSIEIGSIRAEEGGTVIIAGHDANLAGIREILDVKALPPPPHMVIEEAPSLFLGREAQLEECVAALELGTLKKHMPVLALYGMGGIGKTSLAAAIANDQRVSEALPDGSLWVTLGPDPDVMTWLAAWGKQIGHDLTSSPTPEIRSRELATHLNGKKALIVVDDVWSAAAARWFLVGGPSCRAVVTTRNSDIAQSLSEGNSKPVGVLSDRAPMLLLQGLAPEAVEDEPAAAEELAGLLGGHPLALTLTGRLIAKEWQNGFGITGVVKDLKDRKRRLEMKEDRHRPGLPEEYSLGALFGLSYDHLAAETEQKGFRLLSVFGGAPNSFNLSAVSEVWGVEEDSARHILSSLISQALVGTYGRGRFALHSLLADYAASLVQKGEEQRGKTRHSRFFYALAQNFRSDNLEKWDEWDIDWDNIRLGISWAVQNIDGKGVGQEDLSFAIEYVDALDYLIRRRRPSEGEAWLAAGVTAALKMGNEQQAAWFYLDEGGLVLDRGNPAQAIALFKRSAELFKKVGEPRGLLYARGNLGIIDQVCDRYESALESYRQVTHFSEAHNDPVGTIIGYYNIGSVCFQLGNLPEAISSLRKCIRLCKGEDIKEYCARANSRLAECRLQQGKLRQAERRADRGLEQACDTELKDLMGYAHQVRGQVRSSLGQVELAQAGFTRSLELLQEAYYPEELAEARLAYGKFLVNTNRPQEAKLQLEQAAKAFNQLGAQRREAICHQWMEQVGDTLR